MGQRFRARGALARRRGGGARARSAPVLDVETGGVGGSNRALGGARKSRARRPRGGRGGGSRAPRRVPRRAGVSAGACAPPRPSAEAGAAPASADASVPRRRRLLRLDRVNVAAASAAASARWRRPAAHELLVLAGVAALNAFHQVNVTQAPTERAGVSAALPSAPAAAAVEPTRAAFGGGRRGPGRRPPAAVPAAGERAAGRTERAPNERWSRRTSRPRRGGRPRRRRLAARARRRRRRRRVRLWASSSRLPL